MPGETTPELRKIRSALLAHYDAHARDLPWRRTRDPYAIWVSEIMLQQTRVDTVLRYYDRFLQRFPDAASLARAGEDAVLAAWSGLGYYRRARLLHAGVREVVANYGGQVPEAPELRRKLPGVGRYTAGAIGSIAFDREEPLVDGNVARVFARIFGIDTPLGQRDTEARLWSLAERIVKGPRPGALNQALMELGALTCTKSSPQCARCPVSKFCHARAHDRAAELPRVLKKAPPQLRELVALIALDPTGEHILLQRSDRGLFHGLWNLPMGDGHTQAVARELASTLGLRGKLAKQPIATLDHVLTHRRLRLALYVFSLEKMARPEASQPALRLQARNRLSELGISSLTQKALAALEMPAQLSLVE